MPSLKKRPKLGNCDISRCRVRENITVIDTPNGGVQLCTPHLNEYGNVLAGVPDPEAPTAPDTAAAMRTASDTNANSISYSQSDVLATVEPLQREAESNFEALKGIQITTQIGLDKAGEFLREIKGKMKALEAQRTSVTKPMLDAKKQIDAWFKPAKEALTRLETLLKNGITGYMAAQEKARLDALTAGDHDGALAIDQPTAPAGVSTRTIWKYRITDAAAVPREWLVIDHATVQAYVNEHKAQSSIPGIEAYPDTSVSARAS